MMIKSVADFLSKRKKAVVVILLTMLIFSGWCVFNLLTYKYISIEFKELRPIHGKIDVFYKGIKVGRSRDIKLCHECKSARVKVVLTYKGLMLPVNTTAKMKKERKYGREFDFIELIYPKKPSDKMIADGSVLQGKTTIDIISFIGSQDLEDLDAIKENLTQSSKELTNVLSALGDLFTSMNEVVSDSKENLSASSYNVSKATGNLRQITSKFDNAIKQQGLNESVSNIYSSTSNIRSLTGNLNDTSLNLNSATVPQVESTLSGTQSLLADVGEIACNVKETLTKPFGGLRLLFGKVIEK